MRCAVMTEKEKEGEKSFAELFEAYPETPRRKFSPGDAVSGTVVKITRDTIFVDLGGKSEGFVETQEFSDKEGNVTVKEGQRIDLKVASVREGIHLSKGIRVQGDDALDILKEAQRNQLPVEGRVSGVKKGGMDVDISGMRAFCPLSQIDIQFCDKPEEHVGKKYLFRIMELKERGRNIVVSRRQVLQEEQDRRLKEIIDSLQAGIELDGKVTKIADFGVFVDVGGVEGMVHISEISRSRINHPSQVLKPGQAVRVKVLKVESDKGDRKRIALSMKALESDPWEKGLPFHEGEIIPGKISRLAEFGAFVEIAPGVDGLVHISEISYDRISHPGAVLHEGDVVEVLVREIDLEKRRISLSIKDAAIKKRMAEEGEQSGQTRLEVGQILKGIVDNVKPYGLFVRLPQIGMEVRGLLPNEELADPKGDVKKKFPKGREVRVEIVAIDQEGRIRLSEKSMAEREDRADYESFMKKEEKTGKLGTLGDLLKDIKI
jgi:small subunit ribosomal protein S1